MRSRIVRMLAFLAGLALLGGCGDGGDLPVDGEDGEDGEEWTMVVFLDADNDLERLSCAEAAGPGPRVNVLVLFDD